MNLKEVEQRLAETGAREKIISRCNQVLADGRTWYDTSWRAEEVRWEVKYLRMRGKLMHHPERHNLVLIRT